MQRILRPVALAALLAAPLALGACDRDCEFDSTPVAEDEPFRDEDPFTAADIAEAYAPLDFEVEVHWDEDLGASTPSPAESGIRLDPPRGSATLALSLAGLASPTRFESTCGSPGLRFDTTLVATFDDEVVLELPAASVFAPSRSLIWVSTVVDLSPLSSVLRVDASDPSAELWARLRDDGTVEQAGLTLVGEGFHPIVESDRRSPFR